MRALLFLCAALGACEPRRIDLAPPTADTGTSCALGACAPGERRCDTATPSLRLICRDGCLVVAPCEQGLACSAERPGECAPIQCETVSPWELLQTCDDPTGLCDTCGPCADCTGIQPNERFCAPRPGGETAVLTCAGYCFQEERCPSGGCATGLLTEVVACADVIDCAAAGCTNLPVCGSSECGPCGCCDIDDIGNPELCWWGPDGRSEARYLRNGDCYEVDVCPSGSACDFDTQGKTRCIVF